MTARVPRRIVFVPNVLISAAITPAGSLGRMTELIDAGRVVPIVSAGLIDELATVLTREKFRRYLSVDTAEAYVAELTRLAESHADPSTPGHVSPDADDDYLVALALDTGADALVSGDPDLHGLPELGIRILTPRELPDLYSDE